MITKGKNISALLLLLFLGIADAYARGGGGGGGGGGGAGGGGGGGGFGFFWLFFGTGPIGKVLLVIVVIAYIYFRYNKNKNSGNTGLVSENSQGPKGIPKPINPDFFDSNPGFTTEEFSKKAGTAFMGVQEAWMNKNLGKVRRWISDGVYQRFNVQFIMMKMLEQTNPLSNINIKQIRLESADTEGAYSIITASVYFSMDDTFICKKDSSFNEKFIADTAVEYWTFIKKSGVAEKDLYHSNNCPKCGNLLTNDGGQVSKCESCGTVTYLGDYDWVLCEIAEQEDYEAQSDRLNKNAPELQPLYEEKDGDFCIKLMEDKASNAIMQYFASKTTQNLKYLRRFTDDALFAQLEPQIKQEGSFMFNRLYLNDVSLVSMEQADNYWNATFNIYYSSMRLTENAGQLQKFDDTVVERSLALVLSKKVGAVHTGELWSFACPNCGAPYTDTTVTECSYCSAKINSGDNDWVMTALNEGE